MAFLPPKHGLIKPEFFRNCVIPPYMTWDDFNSVEKNGTQYNHLWASPDTLTEIGEDKFIQIFSADEWDAWLNEVIKPVVVLVKYDSEAQKATVLCNNGRKYVFDCYENWTYEYAQQMVDSLSPNANPILILPSDLADALSSDISLVSDVLNAEKFLYATRLNLQDFALDYILLVPILFERIDEGDYAKVNLYKNSWNAAPENINRQLPETILFEDGYKFYNAMKDYLKA